MSIEAMKQALEALRNAEVVYMEQLNAMYALQQAIVEADQQEPVAWMSVDCVGERYLHFSKPLDNDPVHPLYTAPVHASDISQERVDETAKDRHEFEEMVKKGTKAWADTPDDWVDDLRGGVEIVPSDHTNSHQPVAWREIMGKWKTHYYDYNEDGRGEPLYTAPCEWVGLKDEELPEGETYDFDRGVRWAETKLKERNT